jgi:hypothetical protein
MNALKNHVDPELKASGQRTAENGRTETR